jgi:hypothetical protein
MGCCGSKSPDILVSQSPDVLLSQVAIEIDRTNYLELDETAGSGMETMVVKAFSGEKVKSPPSVKTYSTTLPPSCGSGYRVVAHVVADTCNFPDRNAVVTIFDSSSKPAAVLAIDAEDLKNRLSYGALYARDAPGPTSGTLNTLDKSGQKMRSVPASKTMTNGVVMPIIGMMMCDERNDAVAFCRQEGNTFKADAQPELFIRSDQTVFNAKGEVVAYRDIGQKKVFVAAGVDAVFALALVAANDVGKPLELKTEVMRQRRDRTDFGGGYA